MRKPEEETDDLLFITGLTAGTFQARQYQTLKLTPYKLTPAQS